MLMSQSSLAQGGKGSGQRAFSFKEPSWAEESVFTQHDSDTVILDIPFVHQTQEFTCGAACVIMAMKYFDPSVVANEDLEIDIWREANLVEDWATCGRGLAYSAAKRGLGAEIIASVDDIPFRERIFKISPNADKKVLDFFFHDMKRRALSLNVPEKKAEVTLDLIRAAVLENSVPILLTSSSISYNDDIPHWIVVRGWNREGFLIYDPLWEAPRDDPIKNSILEKWIGYGSGQIMIKIFSKAT